MREFFRLKQGTLATKHDLWIVMRKRFERADRDQLEKLFTDALIEINYK